MQVAACHLIHTLVSSACSTVGLQQSSVRSQIQSLPSRHKTEELQNKCSLIQIPGAANLVF